jgi:hypothetical protein
MHVVPQGHGTPRRRRTEATLYKEIYWVHSETLKRGVLEERLRRFRLDTAG